MPIDPSQIIAKAMYSVAEAAALLRVKEQTIRLYLHDGKLKGTKSGNGRWKIPGREILHFINGKKKS